MQEKVILIHIGCDFPRSEEQFPTVPPLGILAVGSYLTAQAVPVELIDVQMDFGFGLTPAAEQVINERVAGYLQSQADSIAWVGISQLSNVTSGIRLAQEVHAALPETPIVLGGYFPTGSYSRLLRKYPFITAIVRGDGEEAALQISRSLARGESFLSDRTPNLAWLSTDGIRTTPVQCMDVNHLPILDFGLLRNPSCYPTGSLMTSRGCPFQCIYCTEQGMRPRYAPYPLEWVDRQLGNMEANLACRQVTLMDPLFGVGRERTREVCRIMSKYPFKYAAESRVDVFPPDLVPDLVGAGVELIFWGLESASPATLVRMGKVRSEPEAKRYIESAFRVLRACFEHGVVPEIGLMGSFPGDTEADLQASLEFVKAVEQLHDQVSAETGFENGFMSYSQFTRVYDGTPLAERLEKDFQVTLGEHPVEGERIVLTPSPGLSAETVRRYEMEINQCMRYVPKVEEVTSQYIYFSGENFAKAHPELTDDQGVTLLSSEVKRFSELYEAETSTTD
jgi:radical SAM superfamily enzyme YgiQ (UPF0313 family)